MSIKLTHRVETTGGVISEEVFIIAISGVRSLLVTKPELIELKNLIEEELKK